MPSSSASLTIQKAIAWATTAFASAKLDSPSTDAEWIVADILSLDRPALYLHSETRLSPSQICRLKDMIDSRSARVPLQHVLGHTEFFSLPFKCSPDALIPRPETELLVETTICYSRVFQEPRILDLCTGSGAIAVSLAHSISNARITATDISHRALRLARRNARLNGVQERVSFLRAHFLACFGGDPAFHLIVANPPYIPTAEIASLQPEVTYDPRLALDGGTDGLAGYRAILLHAPALLMDGGSILMETGHDQSHRVAEWLAETLSDVKILEDLSGIERFVTGKKPAR